MGLQYNLQTNSGINCPEAYLRVVEVRIFCEVKIAQIEVKVYKDYETAKAFPLKEPVFPRKYLISNANAREASDGIEEYQGDYNTYFTPEAMSPEPKNAVLMAYEFLKTLPEFIGSIDILEDLN